MFNKLLSRRSVQFALTSYTLVAQNQSRVSPQNRYQLVSPEMDGTVIVTSYKLE